MVTYFLPGKCRAKQLTEYRVKNLASSFELSLVLEREAKFQTTSEKQRRAYDFIGQLLFSGETKE